MSGIKRARDCESSSSSSSDGGETRKHRVIVQGSETVAVRAINESSPTKTASPQDDTKKPYACDLCHMKFAYRSYLGRHMRVHSGERPFKCSKCPQKYRLRGDLTRHERAHKGEKPFQCTPCGKSFLQRSHLMKHQNRHCRLTCKGCQARFDSRTLMQNHIETSNCDGVGKFRCDYCGKSFASARGLSNHARIHRRVNSTCGTCMQAFDSLDAFRQHAQKHTSDAMHVCSVCNQGFSELENMRKHVNTHESVGPDTMCNKCPRVFQSPTHLQTHDNVVHSARSSFICMECEARYLTKSGLFKHATSHMNVQSKNMSCNDCDRTFANRSNLKVHIRNVHANERRFACGECHRKFGQRSTLIAHSRTHTGEKPFECDECDRSFSFRYSLRRHKNVHDRVKSEKKNLDDVRIAASQVTVNGSLVANNVECKTPTSMDTGRFNDIPNQGRIRGDNTSDPSFMQTNSSSSGMLSDAHLLLHAANLMKHSGR